TYYSDGGTPSHDFHGRNAAKIIEDYYPVKKFPPGDEWIEEEIERFHNQNKKSKPMSTKRSKTRPDSEETTASSSKASKGSKSKRKAEVKAESSDDEAQLHPTKKRRIATPTDNDSDDDDGKEKETAPEVGKKQVQGGNPAEGDAASLFSDDDNAVSPESKTAKTSSIDYTEEKGDRKWSEVGRSSIKCQVRFPIYYEYTEHFFSYDRIH
ncbi:hypothetical protein MPER_05377, partial [Moniliophthora perniciosa FA553]